jgi:phasin family protein
MIKNYDEIVAFSKDNMEAYVASSKKMAAGFEEIASDFLALANKSFDDAMKDAKTFSECKSVTDVFELQNKLAQKNFEHAVSEGKRLTEKSVAVVKDAFEPITARFQAASEVVKAPVAA